MLISEESEEEEEEEEEEDGYLDEVTMSLESCILVKKVFIIFSRGREEHAGTPQLHPILSAEGNPLPSECTGLSHGVQRHRTTTVVGEIHGQLIRGVVHGNGGDNRVDDLQRGLLLGVESADEDVEARQFVLPRELVGEGSPGDGAPAEGLVEEPEHGEKNLGGSDEYPRR